MSDFEPEAIKTLSKCMKKKSLDQVNFPYESIIPNTETGLPEDWIIGG